MMQAFQIPAFALPIADRITDEFECRYAAEIRYWEDGIEYGLQSSIVAFLRKHVHLEEPLVRILLYLDEIRNLDRGADLRKIRSLSGGSGFGFRHLVNCSLIERGRPGVPTHKH